MSPYNIIWQEAALGYLGFIRGQVSVIILINEIGVTCEVNQTYELPKERNGFAVLL